MCNQGKQRSQSHGLFLPLPQVPRACCSGCQPPYPGSWALSEAEGLWVEGMDSEVRWPGFEFQVYHFIDCMTWDKPCKLSEPQFPYLQNGAYEGTHLMELWRLNELMHGKDRTGLGAR